jgi:class 3 adenylate cyclase
VGRHGQHRQSDGDNRGPGCIQVTERTRDLLGDRYLFQERGMIQVKGKGKMLTYFLSGRARKHDQMLDLTEPH